MTDHHHAPPTQDARRHAVANVLAWAPGLVRYAARFTHTLEDAEDAYQCAMEIALTRAPCVERREFVAWLHTVIRHEALRIRRRRQRECPTEVTDLDLHTPSQAVAPDAVAEWRERYRSVQDGLLGLSERTRVCLMLRSAGMQRHEIAELLDVTLRTVSREIHHGRSQLRAFEVRLSTGEECERIHAVMDQALDGEAKPADLRRLSRHTKHCIGCREAWRSARDTGALVATFVPVGLVGADLMQSRTPDAAAVVGWWDRVSGAATVRTGGLVQWWLDIPQLMATKAGASAVAAAAVGAIGTPMVVSSMNGGGAPPRTQQVAVASPATAPAGVRPDASTRPARPRVAEPARKPSAGSGSATTTWRRSASAPTVTVTRSAVRSSAPAPTTGGGSAAAEFAP